LVPPTVQRPAPRQTPTARALVGPQEGRAARPRTAATPLGAARAGQADHPLDALGLPKVRASPSRRRLSPPPAPGRRDTARRSRGDGIPPAPAHLHGLRHPYLCLVAFGGAR